MCVLELSTVFFSSSVGPGQRSAPHRHSGNWRELPLGLPQHGDQFSLPSEKPQFYLPPSRLSRTPDTVNEPACNIIFLRIDGTKCLTLGLWLICFFCSSYSASSTAAGSTDMKKLHLQRPSPWSGPWWCPCSLWAGCLAPSVLSLSQAGWAGE